MSVSSLDGLSAGSAFFTLFPRFRRTEDTLELRIKLKRAITLIQLIDKLCEA